MKKIISFALSALFAFSALSGCAGASSSASAGAAAGSAPSGTGTSARYRIGLVQMMEHTSLDEIRAAIEAELDARLGAGNYTYDYQNGQNDPTTMMNICQKFVADDVDIIIAIATSAAQSAATVAEGTDIPVVFSAVTDPVAAQLVADLEAPGGNVTGTSDAIPVSDIFDLAQELTPDIQTVGVLYCTGEPNSAAVVADARAELEARGLTFVESAVTASAEVQTAAQNLLSQCDALFVPIDNTVAGAISVVADEAIQAGKPLYVAADSMVRDGGLASVGVNYTNLGTQTADMALRILEGEDPAAMPVEVLQDANVVVNEETAGAIGVDVSKYVG